MIKVRLIHVVVQPVFVLDDGETLTPIDHRPVTIPAADWADYSGNRFPREVAEWEHSLQVESTLG